jgi:hypothetical protein
LVVDTIITPEQDGSYEADATRVVVDIGLPPRKCFTLKVILTHPGFNDVRGLNAFLIPTTRIAKIQ